MTALSKFLSQVRVCQICKAAFRTTHGADQSFGGHPHRGASAGRRVHETGSPFNDPSGERLRELI